jgi:hypothetical protein
MAFDTVAEDQLAIDSKISYNSVLYNVLIGNEIRKKLVIHN